MNARMDLKKVTAFYSSPVVIEHYADAAARIGLWESEEKLFTRLFKKDDTLLELGCGAGRIAFGLWELGYRNLLAGDISRVMIARARQMAQVLEYDVSLQVFDATDLKFEDNLFDGAIFGFNGLTTIPTRAARQKAIAETYRVIRPGAAFVFTACDRDSPRYRKFWEEERERWRQQTQNPELDDFGDRYDETPLGEQYLHVPTREEMRADVTAAGFAVELDVPRAHLANESFAVREFSGDCRFWVVRKPA